MEHDCGNYADDNFSRDFPNQNTCILKDFLSIYHSIRFNCFSDVITFCLDIIAVVIIRQSFIAKIEMTQLSDAPLG